MFVNCNISLKRVGLLLFISLFFIIKIWANAAQPGIYHAGGGGGFTLFFPDDLPNFKQIQMQKESISIMLYPGFAVVHGDYYMKNDGDSVVTIKTGYPINGFFNSPSAKGKLEVAFDSLYLFKSFFNDKEVIHQIFKPIKSEKQLMIDFINTTNYEDWYFWETSFPPKSVTKISVQFIVNTNNAKIRKGYTSNKENVFVYVVETGALWKNPIEKGVFKIFLGKGLKAKNILGAAPSEGYFLDKKRKTLKLEKSNYTPTTDDNIIFKYSNKTNGDFDFNLILKNGQQFLNELEVLHNKDISEYIFEQYKAKEPTRVESSFIWKTFVFVSFVLLVFLPIYLIWYLFKYIQKRNKI